MGAIKWMRTYFAMLATPLRVVDVLRGHLGWIAVRLAMVSAIYLAVVAAFGVVHSPLAVLALPAAVATGLAFAAPIAAYSATQERDVAFIAIYRFALIPLFLFSGTFFPVTRLPGWLQPVAYATPLYHGVSLCRGLVLGTADLWPSLGSALYLVVLLGRRLSGGRADLPPAVGRMRPEEPEVRHGLNEEGGPAGLGAAVAPAVGLASRCGSRRRPCSGAGGPGAWWSATSPSTAAAGSSWSRGSSSRSSTCFHRRRIERTGGRRPGRRAAGRLHGLRGPRPPGVLGHERGALRLHLQRLLQAQDRQDLRRHPLHPARGGRRGPGRADLVAPARRPVLGGLPLRHGRPGLHGHPVGRPVLSRARCSSASPSRPPAWPAPPTCGAGRTSTWCRWPSSRSSCSRAPSSRSRSTRAGSNWSCPAPPSTRGSPSCAASTSGHFDWAMVGHVAYLSVMGVVGLAVTARRLARLLLP